MILLDTCAIIWDALAPEQLSEKASAVINEADQQGQLLIADISIWEISMLIKKGRLDVGTSASQFLQLFLQSRAVTIQPITPDIAELSVSFSEHINNDPADRIISATSVIKAAPLVTADHNLRDAPEIKTLW